MLRQLTCLFTGHRYHIKQRFNNTCRRVECLRCERTWAMNDSLQVFLPWDDDFTRLYESLGHRVIK